MRVDLVAEIHEKLHDDAERLLHGEQGAKVDLAIAVALARHERGLTQEQLAELVGETPAYIRRLENGEANPSIGKAGRIMAALWRSAIAMDRPLVTGHPPHPKEESAAAAESAAEPAHPADACPPADGKAATPGESPHAPGAAVGLTVLPRLC